MFIFWCNNFESVKELKTDSMEKWEYKFQNFPGAALPPSLTGCLWNKKYLSANSLISSNSFQYAIKFPLSHYNNMSLIPMQCWKSTLKHYHCWILDSLYKNSRQTNGIKWDPEIPQDQYSWLHVEIELSSISLVSPTNKPHPILSEFMLLRLYTKIKMHCNMYKVSQ